MKLRKTFLVMFLSAIMIIPAVLSAHCQIPCGIYDDSLRVDLMKEHVRTIEKSMNTIKKIQDKDHHSNQTVRWINNKEEHAEKFDQIVNYYFLTQRIKPVNPENEKAYQKYQTQLELLHKMLYYSMKSKQTLDLDHVEKLRDLIGKFEDIYFK